ncbi:hypothetical protein GCG21_09055 [Pseudactinotalea sp. HY160]|uniref:hypothetical protein n=1 Tax=Pseudactinotalea sp. HY160 TaxID=2654490 RepID=UPI00128D4EF6|nr:hypothetical protein [Pseudactinotalea sp. HY160]MPV50150.1 hypothetical protein [Pseudactinotalea sp. HY160]
MTSIDYGDIDYGDGPDITQTTLDVVAGIAAMPAGVARDRAVTDFIVARGPLFDRWTKNLCRINSVPATTYGDDVRAIVAEAAWDLLATAIDDPASLEAIATWEAICYRSARSRVRTFIDKAAAPASGMTTARRRHREAQRSRSELRAALGREPGTHEVIEHANGRLSHLSNQANQGMVITSDDLQLPGQVPDPDLAMEHHSHVDYAEDYVLHPLEGRALVQRIIDTCNEQDELIGQVARLWVQDVYSTGRQAEGGDTVTHIGKALSIARPRVHELIDEIRLISIALLTELGIDGPETA